MCIDATHSDGLGRLFNDEEKRPNAVMKKIVTNTRVSLCLFALRNISAGDEIRYDYGPDDGKMYWRQTQQSCRLTPNQSIEVVKCDTVKHTVVSPAAEVLKCDAVNLPAIVFPAIEVLERDAVNVPAVVSPAVEVLESDAVNLPAVEVVECDTVNLPTVEVLKRDAVNVTAVEVVECDTVNLPTVEVLKRDAVNVPAVVSLAVEVLECDAVNLPAVEVVKCDTVSHVQSEGCNGSIEAGAIAPFIKFEDDIRNLETSAKVIRLVDDEDTNSSVSECAVMQSVHPFFVHLARTIFLFM